MTRRVRTFWVMRQRYRVAANLVTILGALTGVLLVARIVPWDQDWWLSRQLLASAAMVIAVSTLAPRLLVQMMWRVQRRRNYEQWG